MCKLNTRTTVFAVTNTKVHGRLSDSVLVPAARIVAVKARRPLREGAAPPSARDLTDVSSRPPVALSASSSWAGPLVTECPRFSKGTRIATPPTRGMAWTRSRPCSGHTLPRWSWHAEEVAVLRVCLPDHNLARGMRGLFPAHVSPWCDGSRAAAFLPASVRRGRRPGAPVHASRFDRLWVNPVAGNLRRDRRLDGEHGHREPPVVPIRPRPSPPGHEERGASTRGGAPRPGAGRLRRDGVRVSSCRLVGPSVRPLPACLLPRRGSLSPAVSSVDLQVASRLTTMLARDQLPRSRLLSSRGRRELPCWAERYQGKSSAPPVEERLASVTPC